VSRLNAQLFTPSSIGGWKARINISQPQETIDQKAGANQQHE